VSAKFSSISFVDEYRPWLVGSAVLHVVVAFAFTLSTFTIPKQLPQQLAVKAVLVDETKTKAAQEARAQQQREEERRVAAEQRRQREREQQAKQQAERERQQKVEQERKAKAAAAERERKAKLDREQKAKAEAAERQRQQKLDQERKAKAEAERQAQLQRDAEAKAAAERRAQEEAAKLEAERKAKAEAERQARLEAERKAAEAAAARRQAELLASMEAEEQLLVARSSSEMAQYVALIQQKVVRNWAKPVTAKPGLKCEVFVSQIPGGDVTGVRIGSCNGDEAVKRSVEAAVYKSSPLPVPSNPALFERNLRFNFQPVE